MCIDSFNVNCRSKQMPSHLQRKQQRPKRQQSQQRNRQSKYLTRSPFLMTVHHKHDCQKGMWLYHVVKIKSLITLFRTLFLEMLKPKSKHFCFKEVSKSIMLGKVFWKEILRQVYTFKSEMVRLDIHTIIDKSKYIVHVTMFDRFKKQFLSFLYR